jgi:hypothetical protein
MWDAQIANRIPLGDNMAWARLAVLALGLVEGAWMTFDGTRALTVGDDVTPSSGHMPGNSARGTTLSGQSVFRPDQPR